MSRYQELRDRTARELGLAGNHHEAIHKHLDAYEAAYAHELADRIRAHRITPSGVGEYDDGKDAGLDIGADLIDPEVQ